MKKFAFGASKFFLGSVFGCVFVLLLFFTQCTYAKKQTFLLSNIALLLFGIPLFVLFLSLDRLQQVKLSWHRPTVSSDVLIYCLCLLLFSAQLYISYNIYFETGWDAGLLTENARNLMHKHSVDIRYFSNYPNNLLYFFFELFVFKLNKYFSIFSDTQQALCVITVNCALNTLSCLLVYKVCFYFSILDPNHPIHLCSSHESYTLFSAFFSRYSALGFPRGTSSATQTL